MASLIETVRIRGGRAPLWYLHLRRLAGSCKALGVALPGELLTPEGGHDRVHRMEVGPRGLSLSERPVGIVEPVRLISAGVVHQPYPHKTTERAQFDRVLHEAKAAGADDGLMFTAAGFAAEAAIWSLFWWDDGRVCGPELSLGVLPGVARARLAEITGGLQERRLRRPELDRVHFFLANAVRGVVQVASLDGRRVAPSAATDALAARFWP
jgi:branched-subunit amino acid aminotransferase/4-amino-4-deoxychorismate lyase